MRRTTASRWAEEEIDRSEAAERERERRLGFSEIGAEVLAFI